METIGNDSRCNKKIQDRNKIDLAIIRAIVINRKITTPSEIAKHVTCNKATISKHLRTIANEVTDKTSKSRLFDPYASSTVDLFELHSNQVQMLSEQSSELREALKGHESGSRDWINVQKQLIATNNELNKLSGLQCALDISKAAKLKQLDQEDLAPRPVNLRNVGYTPSTLSDSQGVNSPVES